MYPRRDASPLSANCFACTVPAQDLSCYSASVWPQCKTECCSTLLAGRVVFFLFHLFHHRSNWDSSWRRGRCPTHVRVQKLDKWLWVVVVVAVTFKTQSFSKRVVCSW